MQNTHESVHLNAAYWWAILENYVATQGSQGDEWKQQRPEHQLEWIQYLANDLLTLKQQVEQRQNLARLYFVPTFVNHSLDFDIHWPEEKQQRDDAYLVYKRYPMLLFAVESIQCDHDKGMAEQVQMQALSIIAESAVCEWPVEMWKDGQKFYWDRQRLYLCKKESATKSSVTYQIRFLALVHSKELSYKESLHKATAHHFLEDLGKDIQNLQANHGKGQPISRSIGYILYQDKEAKGPAAKRSKMTASRVENEEINIEYEIDEMKKPTAVIITCIPENKAGTSKLWTRMGDDTTYEHFTIQFGTRGCKSSEPAGINKYRIYTEIILETRFGILHLGENKSIHSHFRYPGGLTSFPFELTSNPSTHEEGHYFPFAWPIITNFYREKNHRSSIGETLGLNWRQLSAWFSGLIAAQSDHFCRKLDDSEMRSFRRMCLMNRVMKAAGQNFQRNYSNEWNATIKQQLQELEFQMFGTPLTGRTENDYDLRTYLHGISKILRQATLDDSFLITEDDLNQPCYYINRNFTVFHTTQFNPIQWLLNAAEIICDEGEFLHKKYPPSANEKKPPRIPFTIQMFNDGYISLRPGDSASIITKVVTDKMKDFRRYPDNWPPMATLFIRIDDYELKTLCIEFSGVYNHDYSVTEPKFGRISVAALKAKKLYPADSSSRNLVKPRRDNAIFGLKAFFLQGYPAKFKKIMKVKEENNITGMKVFIFPIGREGVSSLYKEKEEIDKMEENEVNPLVGPEDCFNEMIHDVTEKISQITAISAKAKLQARQQYMRMTMSPEIRMPLSVEAYNRGSPNIHQINVQQNFIDQGVVEPFVRTSHSIQPTTYEDPQSHQKSHQKSSSTRGQKRGAPTGTSKVKQMPATSTNQQSTMPSHHPPPPPYPQQHYSHPAYHYPIPFPMMGYNPMMAGPSTLSTQAQVHRNDLDPQEQQELTFPSDGSTFSDPPEFGQLWTNFRQS